MPILPIVALLFFLSPAGFERLPSADHAPEVQVEVIPPNPLVQKHRSHLSLQCDFRISNPAQTPVSLVTLELRELDARGQLIRRRSVNQNGTAPSIHTVISGPVPAGDTLHIFNPFHHFEADRLPARFEFVFTFQSNTRSWTRSLAFDAVVYQPRTALRLPLDGRLFVWDGHDYLSHHRRIGYDHPVVRSLGLTTNSGRYAYDFVLLGPDGEETHGTPKSPEDWYGWGAPVLAPGPGRVVALESDFPDSAVRNGIVLRHPRVQLNDMKTFAGNYVVLDHGNGEFSTLGHLRQGSVVVAVGDQVQAGDPLGEIGLSGSVTHVHLHYHLQSSANLADAEGRPATFARYSLQLGSTSTFVENAPVRTGDIVEHAEGGD